MSLVESLYIHFPFCFHLCNYCDFYKKKLDVGTEQIAQFQKILSDQWKAQSFLLKENGFELGPLKSLYIGGGTPSLWSVQGIDFFQNNILEKWFSLGHECEFTIEVDPNTFSESDLVGWKSIGVNRISIGSQAFNDKSLQILDRQHTVDDICATVEKCKKYFDNISLDLILGIPEIDKRGTLKELQGMLDLGPDHMSVYMLSTRSNYIHKNKLPDDDITAHEYNEVCALLEASGLKQYEVSNFAKKSKKSHHNLRYWNCNSVAAIGPTATGLLVSKNSAMRYQWKTLSDGFQVEELTKEQFLIEYFYMHLRCEVGVNFDALPVPFKGDLDGFLNKMNRLGYLKNGSTRTKVQLTQNGYLMLDSIMGDLFSYGIA